MPFKQVTVLKASCNALACLFLVAILTFAQPVRAQNNIVRSCWTDNPPTIDGIISSGEWVSRCTFDLQLRGADNDPENPPPPPADKPLTLTVLRDSQYIYLAFQWTHDTQGADPSQYLLGLGFDFDADGLWEDNDHAQLLAFSVHTIDDALLLVYMGHYVGDPHPPPDAWIKFYLPDGLYVLSWGDKNDDNTFQFDGISGPPAEPGTPYDPGVEGPALDGNGNPVTFPHGPSCNEDGGCSPVPLYAYTYEIAVPRLLFHSPAGFGFALVHQTGSPNPVTQAWTWPTLVDASGVDLGKPESAEALGKLVGDLAGTWERGFLDPGGEPAVGGVMATIDKVTLILPWIAALAGLGLVALLLASRKRRN